MDDYTNRLHNQQQGAVGGNDGITWPPLMDSLSPQLPRMETSHGPRPETIDDASEPAESRRSVFNLSLVEEDAASGWYCRPPDVNIDATLNDAPSDNVTSPGPNNVRGTTVTEEDRYNSSFNIAPSSIYSQNGSRLEINEYTYPRYNQPQGAVGRNDGITNTPSLDSLSPQLQRMETSHGPRPETFDDALEAAESRRSVFNLSLVEEDAASGRYCRPPDVNIDATLNDAPSDNVTSPGPNNVRGTIVTEEDRYNSSFNTAPSSIDLQNLSRLEINEYTYPRYNQPQGAVGGNNGITNPPLLDSLRMETRHGPRPETLDDALEPAVSRRSVFNLSLVEEDAASGWYCRPLDVNIDATLNDAPSDNVTSPGPNNVRGTTVTEEDRYNSSFNIAPSSIYSQNGLPANPGLQRRTDTWSNLHPHPNSGHDSPPCPETELTMNPVGPFPVQKAHKRRSSDSSGDGSPPKQPEQLYGLLEVVPTGGRFCKNKPRFYHREQEPRTRSDTFRYGSFEDSV